LADQNKVLSFVETIKTTKSKKMKTIIISTITFISIFLISCNKKESKKVRYEKIKKIETVLKNSDDVEIVKISKSGFYGKYVGPEFTREGDVAHKFSNKTCKVVGRFMKKSFLSGNYLKVDFDNTKITTNGLDKKGKVEFVIFMPFLKTTKCESFTGLAHCGTWVNQNSFILDSRDQSLLSNLDKISVGPKEQGYFTTDGGYKEYWVQFKHKNYQSKCR